MKTDKFILHAPNVHTGGGLVLLRALLGALSELTMPVYAVLDSRFLDANSTPKSFNVQSFVPTLKGRWEAENYLKSIAGKNDTVLCFGNLPPLFKLPAHVCLFLQNRNLLGLNSLRLFGCKTGIRIACERLWLKLFHKNVDNFFVQTPSMQELVHKKLNIHQTAHIQAFDEDASAYLRVCAPQSTRLPFEYDFVYVSSADPHKNHRVLIKAWCLLAEQGIRPSLCLTIEEGVLWEWIKTQRDHHQLKVFNITSAAHAEILALYSRCGALIFPSTSESFGMPLIEARRAGLPVLAGEVDFVRDVLDPEQTFDPNSPRSIMRAVLRYLDKPQNSLKIVKPSEFIKNIIELDK